MEGDQIWRRLTKEIYTAVTHPVVEIMGRYRVLAEYHRGIISYQPDCICIRMDYGMLKVCGKGLSFAHISTQQLVISGEISSVHLVGEVS